MAKKLRRLLNKAVTRLDLPPEAVLGAFGLRVIENGHITVENHRALGILTDTVVKISAQNGEVTLEGSGFTVERMEESVLCLRGHLKNISFQFAKEK